MSNVNKTAAGSNSVSVFVPEWLPAPATSVAEPGRSGAFVPDWIAPPSPDPAAEENPAGMDEVVRVPVALTESVGPTSKSGATASPLLIRGGRCVIPEQGLFEVDIRLVDGKIEAMGQNLAADQCEVLDVGGLYVLPGIIDPHTHVGLWDPFATDIVTESRSALANGVTTMGIYLAGQTSYLPILDDILAAIETRSLADVFLHLPIFSREQLEEIPIYHSRYGITSFKAYMCGIPGMIPHVEEGFLLDIMTAVAKLGPGAILNIHAENARLVQWATARIQQQQPDRPTLADWAATHPDFAEVDAVRQAALLAKEAGAKIYFVHIAAGASVAELESLKRAGQPIYAETTSPYLSLTHQTELGPLAKMVPPIRGPEDQARLWQGLAAGTLDALGSDHTPLKIGEKNPDHCLWNTSDGYPAVGTHLPALLDAASKRDFNFIKLVQKITLNPARIFGLYPRKGTLQPGSDADLVVVDPLMKKTVTAQLAGSRSDFALHQDSKLRGWPVMVIKSGHRYRCDPAADMLPGGSRYLRRDARRATEL